MYKYVKNIYIKEIYYKVFLVIMEAEKSHDLLSTSRRLSKAGGVACRHKGQKADGIDSSYSLKA